MTGYPWVFVALLLSVMSGGVVAAFLLISGFKKRKDALPFATFVTVATMATLLAGPAIWKWYLHLV